MSKDYSETAACTLGEFVYKDFPNYQDSIKEELKNIYRLLWLLTIISLINLFI